MNQIVGAAIFYIIYSLFGIIGYSILIRINKKNSILKYLISKPIGLIIFAYPVWLLSSFKILKYNNNVIVTILFVIALIISIVSIYFYQKKPDKKKFKDFVDIKFIRNIAIWELVSILLFAGYCYIRAFQPNLEGTEKFMDLLLYSSAGKTQYMPFADPWMPSKPVNYYYYGFYLFSIIAKIAHIQYSIGYNLSLGLVFINTVLIPFAIVYRLTKSFLFSILGSLLVSVAGNLHYAKCIYDNLGKDLNAGCYYPKSTRILDPSYTINEFPSYSFVLGDLHPHVMSLPFLLTNIYLLILVLKLKKNNYWLFGLLALSLGTSAMINTWDFIALGFIYFLIFIYKLLIKFFKYSKGNKTLLHRDLLSNFVTKNKEIIFISFGLALSPFILFLPFFLHFQSPVEGIGFAPTFYELNAKGADYQYPDSISFLAGIWGFYVIAFIVLIIILILRKAKFKKTILPIFVGLTAIFLIIFTELFYFKDLFHIANPPYFRANTVFKFGYIAWILFGICIPILSYYTWQNFRFIKNLYLGITADFLLIISLQLYLIAVMTFPVMGIRQAYGPALPWNIKDKTFTLDGSAYIKTREPDDYAAIQYINQNFKNRKVILEAVGGSYTYFARIGVNTGMMNPVNWPSHEWTWRFHYPDDIHSWKEALGKSIETGYGPVALIEQDVKKIYETEDQNEARELLKKYNVEYVFVGNLERTTYIDLKDDKFKSLGNVIFQSGNSVLYQLK